ncbi:MAG: spore coat U domain-containing protein [Pseudomonadota bacterium]
MRMTGLVASAFAVWLGSILAAPAVAAPNCHARVSQVDFGRVDDRRDGEITGRLTVTCDGPTSFEVSATSGYGTFRRRTMIGPKGKVLHYNLYVDPARRRVWGDGESGGTARIVGQSDGRKPVNYTVHGRLFKGQQAVSGHYRDSVKVSVSQ